MNDRIIVLVARDYEDLIPGFLANRRKDLGRMADALASGDFDAARFAGHGLKGLGATYGFEEISRIGADIEDAARAEDPRALARLIAEFTDYLDRLQVVFE